MPVAHHRCTWSGIFGTPAAPVEEWSFGVAMGYRAESFGTRSDMNAVGASLSNAISELVGLMDTGVHLTEFTIAAKTVEGARLVTPRDASGAYVQWKGVGTPQQGSGAQKYPLQVAQVMSLHSEAAGAVGRGRFYLPGPVAAVSDSARRIDVAARDASATALLAFVRRLNTIAAGTTWLGPVCIASGGSALQGIAPARRDVTRVSVGRVLDTQRRRRGDLEEDRAFLSV